MNNHSDPPSFPPTSVLSLVFLMMGAPHLYAFLRRPAAPASGVTQYAILALTAGAIASLIELSVF
jgi:hypothetical protein